MELVQSGTPADMVCMVQLTLGAVNRETLRVVACSGYVAGGWVIDKNLTYNHDSGTQDDERGCCEHS